MIVFRLEDCRGAGVYCGGHMESVGLCALDDGHYRPLPRNDGMHHWPRHFVFAWQSWELATTWIQSYGDNVDAALHALDVAGFYLVVYDVDADYIVRGNRQCAFSQSHARIIDRHDCTSLLNTYSPITTQED